MSAIVQCQVCTARPPHYLHPVRCALGATRERDGLQICHVHAREFDRRGRRGYYWKIETSTGRRA